VTVVASLAGAALLGAALGVLNVLALRRAVRRLVLRARPPSGIALGALGRNLLTLGPVFLLASGGMATLSAGLAAFLGARVVAVRCLAARLPSPEPGKAR
jgi:hypothetical protein